MRGFISLGDAVIWNNWKNEMLKFEEGENSKEYTILYLSLLIYNVDGGTIYSIKLNSQCECIQNIERWKIK